MNGMNWNATAFILGGLIVGMPQASLADLVLDDEQVLSVNDSAKVEDREATRKIVKKTQTVETAHEVLAEPVVSAGNDIDYASRSELLRRKRMREEMKNEDLLQQRLEELRLRDEEKRTKRVMKNAGLDDADQVQVEKRTVVITPAPVLQEEIVVAPVTEAPTSYQMNPAPVTGVATHDQIIVQQSSTAAPQQQINSAQLSAAPVAGTSSVDTYSSESKKDEGTRITIQPRFGLLSLTSNQYDMNARFAAGIGVGFEATDQIAVEIGYTYAENGLQSPYAFYQSEVLTYRQNIIDLAMKLYFTDSDSRIRPYIGVGAGYALGYLNYSDAYRGYYNYGNQRTDYELKSFLGILSTGIDFKVSKSISVGLGYKYLNTLSSRQGENLDNRAFYPYGYPGYGSMQDPVKVSAGNSLRDSNMHLIQLGASFSF